jgi:hypothetical protein
MIVVSHTTPLNDLILLDAALVLPTLFGRVYAPSAVIRQLAHHRSPEPVRRWTWKTGHAMRIRPRLLRD